MGKITKDKSDAELLDAYAAGDERAFRLIVERYKDGLYGFLRRFLSQQDAVEDVFQETFVQLYNSMDSFDRSRPLRPWLFTIAANKARDMLRKRQRNTAVSVGGVAEGSDMSIGEVFNAVTSYTTTPYDEVQAEESAEKVRSIIVQMPDNLREILILAYFEQFSYKQMAQILSIPIGTVKSRLHTAVTNFSRRWKMSSGGSKEQ